jgi:hypothetical protein
VDKDQGKINLIRAGKMPIYEPGLDALVSKNVRAGRLAFSTEVGETIEQSLVVFLAVGTPTSGDGSADMSQIDEVAHEIARSLNGYKVIVTKSTVPVGAAARIKKIIEENKTSMARFSVAANPEFLREGAAIDDFRRPDRVVIGCTDEEAIAILKDIYRPLYLIEMAGRKRRARHYHETLRRVRSVQRVARVLDALHRAGSRARVVLPGAPRCRGRSIVGNARSKSDAATEKDSPEEAQTAGGRKYYREFDVEREERRFPRSQALNFKI